MPTNSESKYDRELHELRLVQQLLKVQHPEDPKAGVDEAAADGLLQPDGHREIAVQLVSLSSEDVASSLASSLGHPFLSGAESALNKRGLPATVFLFPNLQNGKLQKLSSQKKGNRPSEYDRAIVQLTAIVAWSQNAFPDGSAEVHFQSTPTSDSALGLYVENASAYCSDGLLVDHGLKFDALSKICTGLDIKFHRFKGLTSAAACAASVAFPAYGYPDEHDRWGSVMALKKDKVQRYRSHEQNAERDLWLIVTADQALAHTSIAPWRVNDRVDDFRSLHASSPSGFDAVKFLYYNSTGCFPAQLFDIHPAPPVHPFHANNCVELQ